MEARKILLSILGVYLLIIAKVAIVNGETVETTTNDLASGDGIVTEGNLENELYTTTGAECVCNCENLNPTVDCVTEAQQESQTNENYTVDSETTTNTVEDTKTKTTDTVTEVITDATTGLSSKPEAITVAPTPLCSTPGLQAHETDCHAFYDCSSALTSDGSLRKLTRFCASNQAFNVEFGACSRDISPCANSVVCLAKGGIADPLGNNSYYLCEPRLVGGGFHVFHVQCEESEIFYPALGKCLIDFKTLAQQPFPAFPPYNWNQIRDIDIVKAELKVIKEHDKQKLKLEKEKLKAEQKLQKEAQKQAELIAKEQEKLLKEQIKLESDNFVCTQEGNFPSNLSETVYYACAARKTKYKKTLVKCPLGSKFNILSSTCVTDGSARSVLETDDDESDDD